ncbi:hypothetical protein [Caballeronia sp. DA-9]|uniref:hypothetical protein n=1 Tax=Caballeronia sp. DA-9 TaxID=3436237 RepID=UPI003F6715C5
MDLGSANKLQRLRMNLSKLISAADRRVQHVADSDVAGAMRARTVITASAIRDAAKRLGIKDDFTTQELTQVMAHNGCPQLPSRGMTTYELSRQFDSITARAPHADASGEESRNPESVMEMIIRAYERLPLGHALRSEIDSLCDALEGEVGTRDTAENGVIEHDHPEFLGGYMEVKGLQK